MSSSSRAGLPRERPVPGGTDGHAPGTTSQRTTMSDRNGERVALITGANRGIGLEAARQLARRGFHVIIASREEEKGRQAVEGIRSVGGEASSLPLDVSSSVSIRAAVPLFEGIADRLAWMPTEGKLANKSA